MKDTAIDFSCFSRIDQMRERMDQMESKAGDVEELLLNLDARANALGQELGLDFEPVVLAKVEIPEPRVERESELPEDILKKDLKDRLAQLSRQTDREIKSLGLDQGEVDRIAELAWQAAQITFSRIGKPEDLLAETADERLANLQAQTRALWKEFAVHGMGSGADFKKRTDLDGRSALGLLELAGINTSDLEYVEKGKKSADRINIDTSKHHAVGVEYDEQGKPTKTAWIDHHAAESTRGTSATKFTYEILLGLGLLAPAEYLNKLVEFVNRVDNKSFPEADKHFPNSARTILGLERFMSFENLVKFFKSDNPDPTRILTDQELQQYHLAERSVEQQQIVDSAPAKIQELEEQGMIVDSRRYGRIVVDVERRLPGGCDSAMAFGKDVGAYIIWSPARQNFFISSRTPITEQFSQGINVRGTMWLKEDDDLSAINPNLLAEILTKMTDRQIKPTGELRKYFKEYAPS